MKLLSWFRAKFPLLHIMGASSTHQSLSLGYCFMQNESKENYVWALKQLRDCYGPQLLKFKAVVTDQELALMNAINKVFPDSKNLLCKWHIENNILSNIKTYFSTLDWEKFEVQWNELCNSITPSIFDQNLEKLRTTIPTKAYDYIFKTWIGHKEKFVLAWTKYVSHFGHTVTSWIEGGHANIKGWIPNTNGDLETVYGKLLLACQQQRNHIFHKIDYDRTHVLTQLRPKFWDHVNQHISQYALLEVINSQLAPDQVCLVTISWALMYVFIWSDTGLQTISKVTLVRWHSFLLICIFHLDGTPLCSFYKAAIKFRWSTFSRALSCTLASETKCTQSSWAPTTRAGWYSTEHQGPTSNLTSLPTATCWGKSG